MGMNWKSLMDSHTETVSPKRGPWVLGFPTALTQNHRLGTQLGLNKDPPPHHPPAPQHPPPSSAFPSSHINCSETQSLHSRVTQESHSQNNSSIIPVNLPKVPQGRWKVQTASNCSGKHPCSQRAPTLQMALTGSQETRSQENAGASGWNADPITKFLSGPRQGMHLPISLLVDQENPHPSAKRMFCHRRPGLGNGEKKRHCVT